MFFRYQPGWFPIECPFCRNGPINEDRVAIVWLSSYPKSGNTWTRVFLANLFLNPDKPVDINTLPNFTFGEHRGEYYEKFSGKKLSELSDEEINQLRPAVQRHIASASRQQTLFVKTHSAVTHLDGVPTILPEVTDGAIYIVRNPLDVAVSYAHHLAITFDEAVDAMGVSSNRLATVDNFAFQLLGSWTDHVRSWLTAPGLRPHVMRYEDMLTRPELAFGSLVKFLRLPENPARLRKAIQFSSFKTLSAQESERGFIEASKKAERFFRQGKSAVWQTTLTSAQIDKIVRDHGEFMTKFGYLKKDGTPVRV